MKKVQLTFEEIAILTYLQATHDDQDTREWAEHANEVHRTTRRGAAELADIDAESVEICLIFGNDGFATDARSQREVATVVRKLVEMEIEILGFGVESTGHTWAIKVQHNDHETLLLLVRNAWHDACGIVKARERAAINAYLTTPW